MDIHSSVNLPFGLLLDNLSFAKTYFPIGIFLASGFTIKVQKTLHAFA